MQLPDCVIGLLEIVYFCKDLKGVAHGLRSKIPQNQ